MTPRDRVVTRCDDGGSSWGVDIGRNYDGMSSGMMNITRFDDGGSSWGVDFGRNIGYQ